MGQKIGRSGVELTEVRGYAPAEGDATGLTSKPRSAYHEGMRRRRGRSIDHPRSFFAGFGDSKLHRDNSKVKVPKKLVKDLLALDGNKNLVESYFPHHKGFAALAKLDLVIWSTSSLQWQTMAEGRRVAEQYR
jgi:hypothetical protein